MKNHVYVQDKALSDEICDNLISLFEKSKGMHTLGRYFDSKLNSITTNTNVKDCTEINFNLGKLPNQEWYDLIREVADVLRTEIDIYKNYYFELDDLVDKWSLCPDLNLQKYSPGQGFKQWHCECPGGDWEGLKRILAWMIYLNDVEDGGTDFLRADNVEAKKGRIVIWPAYWTHIHRGHVSYTKTKYILTGWFNFTLE